jgi:hypothetical protein
MEVKMNRLASFSIILSSLVLFSCAGITGLTEMQGTLSVTISAPQSKALTNTIAAAAADRYEFFAYSPTGGTSYHGSATAGTGGSITVPVGTYTVIAVAGKNNSDILVNLLGATKATNVSVTAGAVTPLAMTLQCISMSLTVPATVATNATYAISVVLDSGLAEIRAYGGGISPRVDISGTGYTGTATSSSATLLQSGTTSSLSYSLTAPSSACNPSVKIGFGGYLKVVDGSFSASAMTPTYGFLYTWYSPDNSTLPIFTTDLTRSINFAVGAGPSTGLALTIGWGT